MTLSVVSCSVRSDKLKIIEELSGGAIVLIVEPCIKQVEPHFLWDNLAILNCNLLLNSLFEVNKVFFVFLHESLQILLQLYQFILFEATKIHFLIVEHNVPKRNPQLFLS